MLSRNKNIIPPPEGSKRLSGSAQSWDYTLGDFSIRWAEREAQLLITHRAQEEPLLATPPGEAFLATARAKLLAAIEAQHGAECGIDILVNNVGTNLRKASEEYTEEEAEAPAWPPARAGR